MKITLLTHFKEFEKRSNTGRLIVDVLGENAEQIRWNRLNPPVDLVREIDAGGVALIYPGAADESDYDFSDVKQCIIIDSTWQEARKIHQRSPYLQKVRRISLNTGSKSLYNLRKHQKESGLCTAECAIEVLRRAGRVAEAELLHERFLAFIRPQGVMRGAVQGH
ncbi:MAG: DTW domain-containing protein [Desulfuromonadaceae bacterium]|nr:DTW domain-containing protein [Desulfuromonadaceae bacterium]MDD2856796.1 DTW domain-containing protein [Desulfuromonadaceae bacterium]